MLLNSRLTSGLRPALSVVVARRHQHCSVRIAQSLAPTRTSWTRAALESIALMHNRSTHTPLIKLCAEGGGPPCFSLGRNGIDLYLKDESAHRSGSLKHRLAKSLFTYKLASGLIREGMTVVEASSGSTAISEAYFAGHLGLPFIAVLAASTSAEKVKLIEHYGGKCVKVTDPSAVYSEAASIVERINAQAAEGQGHGAHYIDQFTNAEVASDWRNHDNLPSSIFHQMRGERYPIPQWFVVGAGTGGTATTIGRFLTYHSHTSSKLCVVDPESSVFFDSFESGDRSLTLPAGTGSRIEGIGRPRVEPSFKPEVIDCMIKVPDEASVAAMRFLHKLLGVDASVPGPSTGTNLYGCIQLIDRARRQDQGGFSMVSLLCDNGRRYQHTVYNDDWLFQRGIIIDAYYKQIQHFWRTGELEHVQHGFGKTIVFAS